jgi:DNA-binding NarL/FixJ family response regulator
MSVSVVIVDDHAVFRQSLRAVLQDRDGIDVVDDVGTGAEAMASAERHRPDVVVLDVRLPDRNGVSVTESLTRRCPDVAILILSSLHEATTASAALRAGARGYLVKTSPLEVIVRGILTVASGQTLVDTVVADALRNGDRFNADSRWSPREQQLLELLAIGASTSEMARGLHLSEKTVRNYTSALYAKLGASSRSEAVLIARAQQREPY